MFQVFEARQPPAADERPIAAAGRPGENGQLRPVLEAANGLAGC